MAQPKINIFIAMLVISLIISPLSSPQPQFK